MNCATHPTVEMLPTGETCDCCGHEKLSCPWCDEVRSLKREIETQKAINTGPMLVVPEGTTACVEGPIGLLQCNGGTVHMQESSNFPSIKGQCTMFLSQPSYTISKPES